MDQSMGLSWPLIKKSDQEKITKDNACEIPQLISQTELHEFLLQTGPLAGAVAQEIQVRTADSRVAFDEDFFNARGTQQESPLNSYTITSYPADCKIGVVAAASMPDNGSTKFLGAFVGAFFDAQ
jgi:hypothetical protein